MTDWKKLLPVFALIIFYIFSYSFSITAMAQNQQETSTLTDVDGNTYKTIKIGGQWWMAENLKVKHYRNGDPIPYVESKKDWSCLTSGAHCYYDNNGINIKPYGALYNWYAVNDSRGLAPEGWHIPSDEEWQDLVEYLGGIENAGGKLKAAGLEMWKDPNIKATNASGFTALPGGYRDETGYFSRTAFYAFFWSATEENFFRSWYRSLRYFYADVSHYKYHKGSGLSIRCVKDR